MQLLTGIGATLLFASSAVAVSSTFAYPQPSQTCVAGVHMIIARASTEKQDSDEGAGIIGAVAKQISDLVKGSDFVGVTYPATLSEYQYSEQEGVVGMKQLVTEYVNICPGHKIALLGYSQGAMVVGDTVIGNNETNFSDDTTNPIGLGTNFLDQIVAIIQMGDPSFTTNTPGHVGTSKKDGVFPRRNVDAYTQYGFDKKMQTYCDDNDLYCASGSSDDVHLGYIGKYASDAASYVASKFTEAGGFGAGGAAAATGSSSSGGSSNSSPAGTTSSTPAKTSAPSSSRATTSAARTTAAAAAAGGKTTTGSVPAIFSSNRFQPFTGIFSGRFEPVGDLQPSDAAALGLLNAGGIHTAEMGFAGTVMGFAMFVMGML